MFGYKSVKECCYNLTPKLLMVSQRAITGLFYAFDGWFNLAIGAKQLASHSMAVTERLMDHSSVPYITRNSFARGCLPLREDARSLISRTSWKGCFLEGLDKVTLILAGNSDVRRRHVRY